MFSLDQWKENANYIIIDDIEWEYVPCKKALFGAQREFIATDKYRKKRKIKWGKPCIYLFNEESNPLSKMSGSELDWYRGNTIFIEIKKPLF